ncbi:hypothetical protein QBC40DRAFT_184247 [Triangularia verruculosa]|uniref:Uncharacterized protein n=1 Tax=Triangularia verruculosa TaxID=2587418 RepID=A0AAN7ASL6_9PEZI|nr:hypothetical protein QBC40DRAFT_184247 [Triangularia verruculosa]
MTVLTPQETATDSASETGAAPQARPGARCLPRHRLQTALIDTHRRVLHDLHRSQFDNSHARMENVRCERHRLWPHGNRCLCPSFAAARCCPPRLTENSVIPSFFHSEICGDRDSPIHFEGLFVFAWRNSSRENQFIHDCVIPLGTDERHTPLRSHLARHCGNNS